MKNLKSDYRATKYYHSIKNISNEKNILHNHILQSHPNVKNFHPQVKKKYKLDFVKVYDFKCCYCGNSIENSSIDLFEIDHYICESSFKSKVAAGYMGNLVLACYECNRKKSGFIIDNCHRNILNPDENEIKNVFYRDSLYNIKISNNYIDDTSIQDFYSQLDLDNLTHRLDYLLMNIRGLCKKLKTIPSAKDIYDKLNESLIELQKKRNQLSCFK